MFNFKDVWEIRTKMIEHPKETSIILSIVAVVILLGFFLHGLLSELGRGAIKDNVTPRLSALTTTIEGDNIVEGDFVAGNKYQTNISDEDATDIAVKVCNILDNKETVLNKKYPGGHTGFGIHGNDIIVPRGCIQKGFNVKWETGKILFQDDDHIKIVLPDMIINTEQSKDISFSDCEITIQKRIGVIQKGLFRIDDFEQYLEVIALDEAANILVIGVGFTKTG